MGNAPKTGVGGTVDAFNFIRRVAFPSTTRVLSIFAGIVLGSSIISLLIVGENVAQTLVFAGAVLFWPGVVGELANSILLLGKERVLDFRRLMGIEIISAVLIGGFLLLFSIIGALLKMTRLWEAGFLIGLALSLPLRFLTPMAMSSMNVGRKLAAGLPTVLVSTLAFSILNPFLSPGSNSTVVTTSLLVLLEILLSAIGVLLIIRNVEKEGMAEIHHSPMGLFRSFLDHWLRKSPAALEERLVMLSTEGSIETKILSFSGKDGRPKASLVVSNFHPGPYRDMGSGGLPSELKRYLELTQSGIVQVPHGISNHKLNIVSHRDIDKLLSAAKENYPSDYSINKASPLIREQEGEAIVSGQAFGNVVLLTVTLSPQEMEDLPTEVATGIEREASKNAFEVLVVDAHNSLAGQTSITPLQAERIIKAGVRVIDRLASLAQEPFRVGSSFDALDGYGLKDGIGPGGMSVMAVKTGKSTFSYITIDGNNMQQGLRDRILQSLQGTGITDAEIMTTDTHLVTGLVRSPLGYYPVGAALQTDAFIAEINDTVRRAIANMEDSTAGASRFSLTLRVLGSQAFNSISSFVGRIARQIGRSFLWLEFSSLVLALVILFVV